MKIKIIAILIFLSGIFCNNFLLAQENFDEYAKKQRQSFDEFFQKSNSNFNNYRDSVNREFASFLEQAWKKFELKKPEPLIKTPITKPPVFDNTEPKPKPEEVPVITPPVEPKPDPVVVPKTEPKPAPVPENIVSATFFGTSIKLKQINIPALHLLDVSEQKVAQYWVELSKLQYVDIQNEALRIKQKLNLNDWGLYQLLNKMFDVYIRGNENEQVVFSIFMLNQMGYRAKIGRNSNSLVPLVAFLNNVTNCSYFDYGSAKYYALNPQHKNLTSIRACPADYADANSNLNLEIQKKPQFAVLQTTKKLDNCELQYNKNIVDFYKDYPCTDFAVYAEAPLDEVFLQSVEAQILPRIKNKSQEEAVNILLDFVQNSFEYKTDDEQFGYEKWNFAEETIAFPYADCEDRSVLFAQLVRHFLKMPVVLVHYKDVHLATAVKFSNASTTGDYISLDGQKFLICDPTYIGATLGRAMPQLKNIPIEVIRIKSHIQHF